jgi:hypothetical protein
MGIFNAFPFFKQLRMLVAIGFYDAKAHLFFGGEISQIGAWQPRDASGYPEDAIKPPALLIYVPSLSSMGDTYKPHAVGWRIAVNVLCVLSRDTDAIQTRLYTLGAAVGGLVSTHAADPMRPPRVGQRWGLGDAVEAPDRSTLRIAPTDIDIPGLSAALVEWTQTIYLTEALPED